MKKEEEKEVTVEDILFPINRKVLLQNKEKSRMYEFSDKLLEIMEPTLLVVTDLAHLVIDYEGKMHYIPYGWKRIIFVPFEGKKFEVPAQIKECEKVEEKK